MPTPDEMLSWRGRQLYDRDGHELGRIEDIYLDDQTGRPKWALVDTVLSGRASTFVPITNATAGQDGVQVPFARDQVQDAPGMDPEGGLSPQQEAELYSHYGMDFGQTRSEAGGPEGQESRTEAGTDDTGGRDGEGADVRETGAARRDANAPTTDDAMTLSEEELNVGTTEREAGRARLRKYVVTEDVTKTVPVRREEVRLERQPVTDANIDQDTSGSEISDEEHEVVLMEEDVVVEKRAVPRERVRLQKDVTTDERQVTEEVRKEQIDVDGEGKDDQV